MSQSLIADLVLLFVTFCWGVTFPLIENSVQSLDPFVFVMVRFFFAALILLPFTLRSFRSTSKEVLFAGVMLGALNAVSYGTQTMGLKSISSAEAAFITGISVILVPFILPFFSLGKPSKKDVICSFLCLLGLYFFEGCDFAHMNAGVLWVMVCAVSVALTIVYLQKVAARISELVLLAFYQIFFTAIFCVPWSLHKSFQPLSSHSVMFALLFCAFFATTIALFLQTKFQPKTTANRAAMIFCCEPIFAAISAYAINGEMLSKNIFLGGLCIFFGIGLSLFRF